MHKFILKILVVLITSLIVSCSRDEAVKDQERSKLRAGSYFGGSSSAFWSPRHFVPPEVEKRRRSLSLENIVK